MAAPLVWGAPGSVAVPLPKCFSHAANAFLPPIVASSSLSLSLCARGCPRRAGAAAGRVSRTLVPELAHGSFLLLNNFLGWIFATASRRVASSSAETSSAATSSNVAVVPS